MFKNVDISVSKETGSWLDNRGSTPFLFATVTGAHPASYPMGTGGSFLGVKLPERDSNHSPPYSAEIKNAWSYTSIAP
jgi:hypothetical protein